MSENQLKSPVKFFGIGMQKTGTTTLAEYFIRCGFKHHYGGSVALTQDVLRGNLKRIWQRIEQYDSFEDAPWYMIYKQLDERFPDAKFIFTVRSSSEKWMKSVQKHTDYHGLQFPWKQAFGYGNPRGHEADFIRKYEEHNEAVEEYFKGRENRCLKVCLEEEDAAKRIWHFLGHPELASDALWSNRTPKVGDRGVAWKLRAKCVYGIRTTLAATGLPMR